MKHQRYLLVSNRLIYFISLAFTELGRFNVSGFPKTGQIPTLSPLGHIFNELCTPSGSRTRKIIVLNDACIPFHHRGIKETTLHTHYLQRLMFSWAPAVTPTPITWITCTSHGPQVISYSPGGNRTHTPSRGPHFECGAYTKSATGPFLVQRYK